MDISEHDIRQLHTMCNTIYEYQSGIISIDHLYRTLESLWHLLNDKLLNHITLIDEINELEILNALHVEKMIDDDELRYSANSIIQRINEILSYHMKEKLNHRTNPQS